MNHRERHRQRNCTRGRTRSGDRWTSGLGRQMSLCLFLPCSPGLLISWAHATPPATLPPAAAAAVTIKPDSSLAQSPSLSSPSSHRSLQSSHLFLFEMSLSGWSPTAAPSWNLCWAALGTMQSRVRGTGWRGNWRVSFHQAELPLPRSSGV